MTTVNGHSVILLSAVLCYYIIYLLMVCHLSLEDDEISPFVSQTAKQNNAKRWRCLNFVSDDGDGN
jgi:hypothetical protein